jgi:predicted HAD superfamily hydrolase
MDNAEVVSFDIFDTLIMRDVLYPRDIFYLLCKKNGSDFYEKRINAEMELYDQHKHPTIYEIYQKLDVGTPEDEIETEKRHLVKRNETVELLAYAIDKGKEVFCVSDMYFPKEIMSEILNSAGIKFDANNILVSCDYGVSKSNDLFGELRKKVGNKKILHIGDNYEADIVGAKRSNVEDTFYLKSALNMIEDSYASKLLYYESKLSNRMIIGRFISRELNNPFLFSKTKGKLLISDVYEMSYNFISPLILKFFFWMIDQANELNIDLILLSARDGYIIEKIYQQYSKSSTFKMPEMKYFYCGRMPAALAGCVDEEDILHAARLAFSGQIDEMLKQRFHLSESDIMLKNEQLTDKDYLLLHKRAILREAEKYRQHFMEYIDKLNIPKDKRIGFFDFVSSGTCQKALGNFVDFDLIGFYFAQVGNEIDYKKETKICAMFDNSEMFFSVFNGYYHIYSNFLFLENIVTSYEATLKAFNESGIPILYKEKRNSNHLEDLRIIHSAILDYAKNIEYDMVNQADVKLVDDILNCLNSEYSIMDISFFSDQKLADEFCNRTFELSSIM